MTDHDLIERLRAVESHPIGGGYYSNHYRNPDGPEAADRIAQLEAEVAAFADALDLADRLIERGYGMDTPDEWNAAFRTVQDSRAAIREAKP